MNSARFGSPVRLSCSASWISRCCGGAPLGDVRQRAGDANRRAAAIARGEAAGQHPAPLAVGVADPVLVLEVRAAARQVMVDLAAQPLDVVGVDELEPRVRPVGRELVVVAQQRLPALREVHAGRRQVPVPDPVVGGAHGDGVALLAAAEIDRRLVLAEGVADRALQARRVDRPLDQVVGDAQLGGLQVDLVVVLSGEHDDRGGRVALPRLATSSRPVRSPSR